MTSLALLLWIASGIVLQLVIYLGILFGRYWIDYQALLKRVEHLDSPAGQDQSDAEKVTGAAWQGFRLFRVDRKQSEDLNQSVCSFYLLPEDGQPLPPFRPGQFLTFRLEVPTVAGGKEEIIRCYSLSDAFCPDYYRVSIKRASPPPGINALPGRSSYYFHDQIAVGNVLQVKAPAGHFCLDTSDAPVVLIAGGIGITPFLSMLNDCLINQPGREIWLFYGVRNGYELLMKSHLQRLATIHPNFHLRLCFSAPLTDEVLGQDYQYQGRIDINLLRIQLPLKPYHFYICGPSSMLESLVPALEDWGISEARIHFEAFGPASIRRRSDSAKYSGNRNVLAEGNIMINFAVSGKRLEWQPFCNNLLELAESNGISISSGCRAGSCGSCQTALVSGEVYYCQPSEYEPEPGTCLLCVCLPKTNLTLEA